MHKRTTAAAAILTLALAAIPAASHAALSAKVFTSADCGTLITASIILKSNVTCPGTEAAAITVGADKLSINLNGYTLTSGDANHGIDTGGFNGTSVSAGTIYTPDGRAGVNCSQSSTLTINKVNFRAQNHRFGYGVKATYCPKVTISNSSFDGLDNAIDGYGSSISVSSSVFTDNNCGFYSHYDGSDNISGSTFTGNTHGIFEQQTSSITITSTVTDSNTGNGMNLDSSFGGVVNISGSYARHNGDNGIFVNAPYKNSSLTSSIVNTVASGNGTDGIWVVSPGPLMTLKGNITDDNDVSGLEVQDNAEMFGPGTASSNSSRNNGHYGFFANYPMLGSNNKAAGNWADCVNFVCLVVKK